MIHRGIYDLIEAAIDSIVEAERATTFFITKRELEKMVRAGSELLRAGQKHSWYGLQFRQRYQQVLDKYTKVLAQLSSDKIEIDATNRKVLLEILDLLTMLEGAREGADAGNLSSEFSIDQDVIRDIEKRLSKAEDAAEDLSARRRKSSEKRVSKKGGYARLLRIIQSGADVYATQVQDQFPVIVYNVRSKGKSASESVISQAAFDALLAYFDIDPDSASEERHVLSDLEFFDPETWVKVDEAKLKELVSDKDAEQDVVATDYNGSKAFSVLY